MQSTKLLPDDTVNSRKCVQPQLEEFNYKLTCSNLLCRGRKEAVSRRDRTEVIKSSKRRSGLDGIEMYGHCSTGIHKRQTLLSETTVRRQ